MITFLKKYRAIPYGFILLYFILKGLIYVDFIRIDPKEVVINTVGFIFWGLVFSVIIDALLFHRKEKIFYWMVSGWSFSLLGFILGNYFSYEVLILGSLTLFIIASLYIIWSWYLQRYKKKNKKDFLQKRKLFLVKITLLSLLFVLVVVVDDYMKIGDNPITFVGIAIFWLGVFYVLTPIFFKRYKIFIIGIYLILTIYLFLSIVVGKRENEEVIVLYTLFLLPIPFIVGLWIYDQWKWFQNLKADKAKAELALLKQQVNPHFFFNTLNNLYGLAKRKSDQTPDLILKLSEIMRYVIYKGKEAEVKLEEEIEYLENYIELQQIRHHEEVKITFAKDIRQNDIMIPPLLFIILLENAFKHGVDSLIHNAYVSINLVVTDSQIVFEAINNYDASSLSEEKGIGLENLKKRLEIIYENAYTLDFKIDKNTYNARLTINN